MALGMGTATIAHKFARLARAEWLFGAALVIAAAAVAARLRKRPVRRSDFEIRKTPALAILAVFAVLIVGILAVDNYRNGRTQPDGSIRVNMHYYDGFIRIPVTRELTHSVPPQMPFAAGIPLAYHYGMDLFTQMFIRYFGLNVFDLNHRLLLTFFFMLTAAAAFIFFRRLFRSAASGWRRISSCSGAGD